MAQARDTQHLEFGIAIYECHVADVDIAAEIDLAGEEGIEARRLIHDGDEFDFIEMGLVVLVIVRIAL